MRGLLMVLWSLWLIHVGYGQVLTGTLQDEKGQEPIPFAHLRVSPAGIATISNVDGEFQLLGAISPSDTLYISHISYQPRSMVVSELLTDETQIISLMPETTMLEEVTVSDVAVMEVVRKIAEQLKESPNVYGKAIYRQTTFRDKKATEWIEALYDVEYSRNGLNQIRIDQARFARKKYDTANVFLSHTNFSYLTVGNSIYAPKTGSTEGRLGRPLAEDFTEAYEFYLDKQYIKGSDTYFEIIFEPGSDLKGPVNMSGKFLYNFTQESLILYTANVKHALGADELEGYGGQKELSLKNPVSTFQFKYAPQTGALEYITVEFKYTFHQDDEVFPSRVFSRLFFYQNLVKRPKKLREPALELENVANFENAKYKPKFWKDNPVIKLTADEAKIVTSFEAENAFGTYFKGR